LISFLVLNAWGCATPDPGATTLTVTSRATMSTLREVREFGPNPGGLKMYEYVPRHVVPSPPLVVAMHGCSQDANDAASSGWNDVADELGFVVVYPQQSILNNPFQCFNFASPTDDIRRGHGENESIKEMVDKAKAEHGVDPKRVFVSGVSAGAAQAALMAAIWPDVFAGAATFAGVPFDCASTVTETLDCVQDGFDHGAAYWGDKVRAATPFYAGPWPRISIWHGSADTTVAPQNRTQLIRQWTNVHGISQTPSATDTVDGYPHSVFASASGEAVVETYDIIGMAHGVPITDDGSCGTTAEFAVDMGICGARRVAEWFGLGTSGHADP
jgi:poly(hydroxyalkanoate) depolymerase family esterase